MSASPEPLPYPYSRESLSNLDRETLVEMFLNLNSKYQDLSDYVRELVTSKYGRKTERFEAPGQLLLFPGGLQAGASDEPESRSESQPESSQGSEKKKREKKPGHTQNPLPSHLPRVPVIAQEPDEAQLPCTCCGAIRLAIRQLHQHSRLQIIPATFYIEDLYEVVYGCPNCDQSEQLTVSVPEPVPSGKAGASLLAYVAVSRDIDHTPIYRQSSMYYRSGVPLHRSTLSDFYSHVASILTGLHSYMHQILLQSSVISTDDTPVKVQDRTKSKNIKTGRVWAYLGDEANPVNVFDYTSSRGRDGPLTFLNGFTGSLQGDCFSGNHAVCAAAGTILVACIAHARRYFIKAMHNDRDGCNQALLMFQSLYEIEKTARTLNITHDELKLMRQQEALPVLNSFHTWLQKQYSIAQPKSSFAKALFYCLNNWTSLIQYVRDGELKIDNNHCEREMKYIAMGRKSWLFYGSDRGGTNHAIVLSVLSTCRRHGVEPWAYLTDVIQRLAEDPDTNLEELLPYNWKQKYPTIDLAEITVAKNTPKVVSA